ncbi:class I SAM-dependent DNA methyltransferase [Demequina sp.]|uniref:class I SAM-dependent DNA methyltransferase n=1 Tax=Demequina sp. TaxID=2050685 RepID=UPI003D0A574B
MTDYDDGHFDEAIAAEYDEGAAYMFAPQVLGPTVDLLERLAGGGRVLEFAIGTGRVALPLAARGVEVHGIEMSRPMVAAMRAKLGGADLPVAIGDMTYERVEGEFSLVYLVYNTIGNVLTQDGQVAVFENAARHLVPGGRFLIEIEVPALRRLPQGERYVAFNLLPGYAGVDEYDTVSQSLLSHHISVRADGTGTENVTPQRYVWPSELDLMARIAGMTLENRWEDFEGTPFTSESQKHVSVWVKED